MSKFDIGNGLFVREGVRLNQTYTQILTTKLRSQVSKVPFKTSTEAAKLINNWVSNVTRNRIQELVHPNEFPAGTSIFLASALYFSGQWQYPFDDKSTKLDDFQLENGKILPIPMMQIEAKFAYNYIEELQCTGLSLPFKDSRFEFIVLKPNDGIKIEQVEFLLEKYQLNLLSKQIKKETRNVFLKMPKFRLDVHYDLVEVMKTVSKVLLESNSLDYSLET